MKLLSKLKESMRFNEVTVGCWGVSFTFRWNSRPPAPPSGGIPVWAVGLGCLLLGAALGDSGRGGSDADRW